MSRVQEQIAVLRKKLDLQKADTERRAAAAPLAAPIPAAVLMSPQAAVDAAAPPLPAVSSYSWCFPELQVQRPQLVSPQSQPATPAPVPELLRRISSERTAQPAMPTRASGLMSLLMRGGLASAPPSASAASAAAELRSLADEPLTVMHKPPRGPTSHAASLAVDTTDIDAEDLAR